jgi:type III secretory pathway component EscS
VVAALVDLVVVVAPLGVVVPLVVVAPLVVGVGVVGSLVGVEQPMTSLADERRPAQVRPVLRK